MKISDLPGWFSQQKLGGKLVIGGVGLFFLLCLCSLLSTTFTGLGQSPTITPTYQGADSIVVITWTPDPNSSPTPTGSPTPTSSPVTTRTPLPTSLPTRSFETATIVVLPTVLRPAITRGLVIIVYVDKEEEYVDIQNFSDAPVSLSGWVLVSERGNQSCKLNGVLPSRKVLRIWTGTEPVGYSCGFLRTIWTDKELDPAVLYNQDGKEVSRYL